MKQVWRPIFLVLTIQSAFIFNARCDTLTTSWSGSQTIPDNNLSGVAYSFSFNSSSYDSINNITVDLNTSGGWDGDLYAYLVHGSQIAVLLNRIGTTASNPFGSGASGLNVQFVDFPATDIHNAVGSTISGVFSADGRLVSPLSVLNTDPRTATLADFLGTQSAGNWTLFIADTSPGGIANLQSWDVNLTVTVPENGSTFCYSLLGISAVFFARKFSGNARLNGFAPWLK